MTPSIQFPNTMAPNYTNLASYAHFIITIRPDTPPLTMFQLLTLRYIREHFPKQYHRKQEWEYQVDDKNKKVNFLQVWMTRGRTDIPKQVLLTEEDSKTMFLLMTAMCPNLENTIIPIVDKIEV